MSDRNPYGYLDHEWDERVHDALFEGRARREARRILHEEENPVQALPETLDLRSRLQRERQETTFRIDGWQPSNGRALLAAQFKAGKTSVVGNLVRALCDGTKWLGVWPVAQVEGQISILDFEMSENTAEDWLALQDIKAMEKVDLTSLRGAASTFNILDPNVRREWAARLAERRTDYLILDCLRPALDALGLDEHRDAGRFLGPFDALLNEAGIKEALVVHHMGHAGERSRGDSRLRDWPDVEWRLMRENEHPDSTRYITAYGRDVDVPEHRLNYDKDTHRITAITGTRLEADSDTALVAVLAVLGQHGNPIASKAVEHALKDTEHTRSAVRGALKLGARRGLIDIRTGSHNSTLYELPRSWIKTRFGGGEA